MRKSFGVYDTVYVDLNNNRDFKDDKPCRKGDEISYWDRDNDGYPDESGGMVYFIADGKMPLPLARTLYGENAKYRRMESWLPSITMMAHMELCAPG